MDFLNAPQLRRDELATWLGLLPWLDEAARDRENTRPARAAARALAHFYRKEQSTLKGSFKYGPDRRLQPKAPPNRPFAPQASAWLEGREKHVREVLAGLAAVKGRHSVALGRGLRRELAALERSRGRLPC